MALLELVEFAWHSFAVLGKFIFYSLLGVSSIAWEAVQFITLFSVTCFEHVHVVLWTAAVFIADFVGISLPYIWRFALWLLAFSQSAAEYTLNGLIDYSVYVWTSPAFVNFRDNLVTGVLDGTTVMVEIGMKHPFWTGQVVLAGVWVALLGLYYRELLALFSQMKNMSVGVIVSGRNFVVQSVKGGVSWILAPVRFVVTLPRKARAAIGSFLQYLTRRCTQFRLAAARPKPTQAAATVPDDASMPSRGPSIFSRFKKTESVEQLERLKNDVRELRTKLEEERESKLCIICQSNFRAVVVMPCKHFATCEECMALLPVNILSRKVCPVCRTQISSTIKVYL